MDVGVANPGGEFQLPVRCDLVWPLCVALAVVSCVDDPAAPRPLFDAASELGLSTQEYPIYVAYGDPTTRVGTICATYRPGLAYELHGYDISDIPCSTSVAATSTVEGAIGAGVDQAEPITATFSSPVRDVFVYSPDVFHCDDDHGSVTGYDVSGMSATAAFTSFDSSLPFCGEDWWSEVTDFGYRTRGNFDHAYDFYALLPTLTSVQRIVITPPPVRAWTTCTTLFAGADSIEASCGPLTGPDSFALYFREAAPSVSVDIITAKGPNDGGSFTARPGENEIALIAQATPASLGPTVTWRIEHDPSHYPLSPLPLAPPQGADASFTVRLLEPDRWPGDHAASLPLEPKQLSYKVTATVTDGTGLVKESENKLVTQDEIDTAREEYVEFGLGVPGRGAFTSEPRRDPGLNTGDYGVMVYNNAFVSHLNNLAFSWTAYGQWQVNSQYRNPVHQRLHLHKQLMSWHLYGCAADIQTFGLDSTDQDDFWTNLKALAERLGFDYVEKKIESGVGHVHVEFHFCQ